MSKVIFDYILNRYRLVSRASQVNYDNTASGLTSVNVKDAIDEVSGTLTIINNNELLITYYEVVAGTSSPDSVTVPTNGTIVLDKFGASKDAILSKIDGNNNVTWESPQTSGGTIVTTSLDADGNYVFSGTPADTNVAIIYTFKIKFSDLQNANISNILYESELNSQRGDGSTITEVSNNYNASAGDFVVMTTGGSDKTVTLPQSPSKDDVINVYKYDNAGGKIIVDGNGNNVDFESQTEVVLQGENHTYQFTGTEWLIK